MAISFLEVVLGFSLLVLLFWIFIHLLSKRKHACKEADDSYIQWVNYAAGSPPAEPDSTKEVPERPVNALETTIDKLLTSTTNSAAGKSNPPSTASLPAVLDFE